jgi:hydrogenase maturation protease
LTDINTKILVLGIGNILLKDEGVGVYVIESLIQNYRFSPNVTLMEGGTLGMKLLSPIEHADYLIVLDAAQLPDNPGTIHTLTYADWQPRLAAKKSLHQVSFMETLLYADMLGVMPGKTIIVGIVPSDISPWGIKLTEPVKRQFPYLIDAALKEIVKAGADYEMNRQFKSLEEVMRRKVELNSSLPQINHDNHPC